MQISVECTHPNLLPPGRRKDSLFMKISPFLFLFLSLTSAAEAQSMFRGNAAHTGTYPGTGPREFHRVKWKFPTGARVVGSPVIEGKVICFGSDDGNVYSLDANSGALRWKFRTGDVVHASPAIVNGVAFVGSWDSYFYAVDVGNGKEKWRYHAGEDALVHNQVGFQSSPAVVDGVVYTGCRDAQLYALDAMTGKEKWKFDNALSWVITSPAVMNGKVYFATSDSSLYHVVEAATGKPILKQEDKAFMFSSPAVTNDVVFIGVLNGTLEARDRNSGELLWEFQTETSKQNANWILTAERRFNVPLFFFDNWREAPVVSADRQFAIGAIFSSPLVANGVVYFGSTDGFLYALE